MFRILAIVFVLAFSNCALAQRWDYPWRSSTAREGELRGFGEAARGQGDWIESLGKYENLHEEAKSKYLENESARIRTRWDLQDEAKDHRMDKQRKLESANVEREEWRLEIDARKHSLDETRKQMAKDGLLPEPQKKKYVRNGVEYDSRDEFEKSPEYQEVLRAKESREAQRLAEKEAEKQREIEAILWLRDWYSKSSANRLMESENRRREKSVQKIMDQK